MPASRMWTKAEFVAHLEATGWDLSLPRQVNQDVYTYTREGCR
jgi:hypothetical protein